MTENVFSSAHFEGRTCFVLLWSIQGAVMTRGQSLRRCQRMTVQSGNRYTSVPWTPDCGVFSVTQITRDNKTQQRGAPVLKQTHQNKISAKRTSFFSPPCQSFSLTTYSFTSSLPALYRLHTLYPSLLAHLPSSSGTGTSSSSTRCEATTLSCYVTSQFATSVTWWWRTRRLSLASSKERHRWVHPHWLLFGSLFPVEFRKRNLMKGTWVLSWDFCRVCQEFSEETVCAVCLWLCLSWGCLRFGYFFHFWCFRGCWVYI